MIDHFDSYCVVSFFFCNDSTSTCSDQQPENKFIVLTLMIPVSPKNRQ